MASDPNIDDEIDDEIDDDIAEDIAEDIGDGEGQEEKVKLTLEIKVEEPSACQRHVTVAVSREDVDRYLAEAVEELVPKAEVPGFRAGRAPKKLVEGRFKEQIHDQVKGSILLDAMTQVNEEKAFSAISEPDFNFDAIDIPADGPLTFEFDLEVRPDFEMPEYKGLKIDRPVLDIDEAAVEKRIDDYQKRRGELTVVEEPVQAGDYVWVDLKATHEGEVIAEYAEEIVRAVSTLSFADSELLGFDELMVGASAGDDRSATIVISSESPKESLRDKKVTLDIHVREVKRLQPLELTDEVFATIGVEGIDQLRIMVEAELSNQLAYRQRQQVREQITAVLIESANWELPPDLLRRQAERELDRAVMELQSSGYGVDDINVHLNRLRQNAMASTEKALKEHFILERIAEEHKFEAEDDEYDQEIVRIAASTGENPRRIRSRMEKRGQMDTLRNQIVERKVLDLIEAEAEFTDVPDTEEGSVSDNVMALNVPIAGVAKEVIPEANVADTPAENR
jgi:trigger factor